jgi:hypothetical protein
MRWRQISLKEGKKRQKTAINGLERTTLRPSNAQPTCGACLATCRAVGLAKAEARQRSMGAHRLAEAIIRVYLQPARHSFSDGWFICGCFVFQGTINTS